MATLLRPNDWGLQKPSPGAQIDWDHPLAQGLILCVLFHERGGIGGGGGQDICGYNRSFIFGPASAVTGWSERSKYGGGYTETATDAASQNYRVSMPDLPLHACTLVIAKRKLDATTRAHYTLWPVMAAGAVAVGSDQLGMLLPWSDTNAYCYFGTTNLVAATPNFGDDVWAMTAMGNAGAGPMRLYQNGILRGSVDTVSDRTNSVVPLWSLNRHFSGADSDLAVHSFHYVYNRVLTPGEVAWVSNEPYAMITPSAPRQRFWIVESSIPATPTPTVVAGTGTVQTPTVVAVPTPSVVAGTGTVQTSTELAVARPSTIAGTGTVSTPATAAAPACVNGTGTVNPNTTLTPDASSSSPHVTGATETWAHTVGSGSEGLLIVGIAIRLGGFSRTVTGVTFNGVPLTFVAAVDEGTDVRAEMWYLLAPAVGTHNIVVTFSAGVTASVGAQSWNGVDQGIPLGTAVTDHGATGTTASVTATSAISQVVQDVLAVSSGGGSTVGAGQTEEWQQVSNSSYTSAGSREPGAASVVMSWTIPNNVGWAQIAVPINPSGLRGVAAAAPAVVAGVGAVQAPTVIVPGGPTAALVAGVGAVQTSTEVELAKPGAVAGTGTVQAPTELAVATPAVIAGVGLVQTSTETALSPPLPDAASSAVQAAGSVITWAHTCSGANRLLVVGVSTNTLTTLSSATYNGVAYTGLFQGSTGGSSGPHEYWIYWVAPALGTHNIVVTLSGFGSHSAGAQSWTGVNQADPVSPIGTGYAGNGTTASGSVSSNSSEVVQDVVSIAGTSANPVAGAGQTEEWKQVVGGINGAGSRKAGAASVTTQWTMDFAVNWVMSVHAIKPVPFTLSLVPDFVIGIGSVQDPANASMVEVVTPTPAVVIGLGSVQSPVKIDSPTPSVVTGTGTVQAPTEVELAKPAVIAGIGTVQASVPVGSAAPTYVSGVGIVQGAPDFLVLDNGDFLLLDNGDLLVLAGDAPSITVQEVTLPVFVAGVGTVFTPSIIGASVIPQPVFVSGTGTVQTPTELAAAKPSNIAGIGTVQSSAAVAIIALTAVVGTGTVQTPTELAAAKPSNIAGIGTIFVPLVVEIARPLVVSGTGTVQSPLELVVTLPSIILGVGTVQASAEVDLPTPANIAGTGTVQTPTVIAVVSATATPSVVAGTGTVQTSTELAIIALTNISGVGIVFAVLTSELARPANIAGTGTVFSFLGVEIGFPLTVLGTGTVQSQVPLAALAALPAVVVGVGSVPRPTGALALIVVGGIGTVQTPSGLADTHPSTVLGVGVVQTSVEIAVARPAVVAGVGTVQLPTGLATARPVVVAGVGTVQSVAVEVVVVLPVVTGVGTVQAPSISIEGSAAISATVIDGVGTVQSPVVALKVTSLANIAGIGTVQSPLELAVIALANIAGIGTVQSPLELAVIALANIAGTGTVQAPTELAVAKPSNIAGTGTVQTPLEGELVLPASVFGTGTVQALRVAIIWPDLLVTGTGVVFTPIALAVAFPVVVTGVGTVGSAQLFTGSGLVLVTTVFGTGTVFVAVPQAQLVAITGVGTVFSPTIVVMVAAAIYTCVVISVAITKRSVDSHVCEAFGVPGDSP